MPRAPRKRTGRVTMQDVADRAGVSIATASFAINNADTTKVSDETRQRIRKVANDLGYRPNAMARSLSKAGSSFVGLVADAIATTPFAGDLIRGAQDAAWKHDHLLLIANTGGSARTEHDAITMMHDHQVRGIVYSTWYHRRVTVPEGLNATPAVLANCYLSDDSIQAFVPDEVQGGRYATDALLDAGHTRIAFINSSITAPATSGRLTGYRAALRARGVEPDPHLVLRAAPEQEGGYEAGQILLRRKRRPTAVFCYNDRVAMGFYDAAREHRLAIPSDITVIGFDNQEIIAGHLRPPLSTVALPHYELGFSSVDWLLTDGLEKNPAIRRVRITCPLVTRSSV